MRKTNVNEIVRIRWTVPVNCLCRTAVPDPEVADVLRRKTWLSPKEPVLFQRMVKTRSIIWQARSVQQKSKVFSTCSAMIDFSSRT